MEVGKFVRELRSSDLRESTFDGDTSSADSIYTDEAIVENRKLINKSSFWINGDNTLTIDINTDLIERTLHNLLGDPK